MPFEYRAAWAGTALTGAGVSVFHARGDGVATNGQVAQSLADRVAAFFTAVKAAVPPGVTWSFGGEVLEFDTATGVLSDVHSVTPPTAITSTASSGAYSRAVGGRIDWGTNAIVAGRRLKGRTFIVPISSSGLDTTGTLSGTALATLGTAATGYRNTGVFTAAQPVVWSRTHGIVADITAHTIVDQTSVLRSRRD